MFGIFLSAINSALSWIFTTVLIKFVVFTLLFLVTTAFVAILITLLPSASSLNAGLSVVSPHTWFFLDAFALNVGLPMILSAYVTRFIIRRIPVIG